MNNSYLFPPLVEANFEVRLSADIPIDFTVPGIYFEKVKDQYPNKQVQKGHCIQGTFSPSGELKQEIRPIERVRFETEDKRGAILIDERSIIISRLRPYDKWANYRDSINSAYSTFIEIVSNIRIERLGLRYINKIEIPDTKINLEEYFNFVPSMTGKLSKMNISDFNVNVNINIEEKQDKCRLQLSPAVPEDKTRSAFMLDLDYYIINPQFSDLKTILSWTESAHESIKNIFNGCLKIKTKNIIRGIN